MLRMSLLVVSFVSFGGCPPPPRSAPHVDVNLRGGFEQSVEGVASGWAAFCPWGEGTRLEPEAAHGGALGVAMADPGCQLVSDGVDIPLMSSGALTLAYRSPGTGRVTLGWYSAKGFRMGKHEALLPPSATWSTATVSGQRPEGASRVQIWILAGAPLQVDDVQLQLR